MKIHVDTGAESVLDDRDGRSRVRAEHPRSTARRGWFAVIVVLDVLAVVAFVGLVVVPRLT